MLYPAIQPTSFDKGHYQKKADGMRTIRIEHSAIEAFPLN
jgi:hypothetical protein